MNALHHLRVLSLIGFLGLPGCAQPVLQQELQSFPFQGMQADSFDEAWTFGEVSGVTPEHYVVKIDHENATTSEGSVRFEGSPEGFYHTLWRTIDLEQDRETAFLLEMTWDQFLGTDHAQPFLWIRIDHDGDNLGMVDSRGQSSSAVGSWESSSLRAAIPIEADAVTIGVGVLGQGIANFDNLKVRLGVGSSSSPPSATASTYTSKFLDIVSEQAMMRDNIEWKQMRRDVASLIAGAESTKDTYPALIYCISALGDHHSRLLTPTFLAALQEQNQGGDDTEEDAAIKSTTHGIPMPKSDRLADDIGYLWLPGIMSFVAEMPRAYASILARALEDLQDCKGFVIDLRQDGGGNMWPMIAGLAPLLGAEVFGSFVYPSGEAEHWWWRDGFSGQADLPCTEVVPPHAASFARDIPLAILTSKRTGSSGEATLVAFLGRPNVRTFGQATAGLSTGNDSISLSDGALLLLTTSKYADRSGKLYGQEIIPDVEVPVLQTGAEDQALIEARAWLREVLR